MVIFYLLYFTYTNEKCNLQLQISTLGNSKGDFTTNIFHTIYSWAIQLV